MTELLEDSQSKHSHLLPTNLFTCGTFQTVLLEPDTPVWKALTHLAGIK